MLNKIMLLAGCWVLSSAAFANADCVRTATGKLVCGNGENAGSYNPNTGTVMKTETNDYGVKTTETSRGGQAKTKNGVGVVQTPDGTTCVKTRRNQGCK
jgi:hypothetical protein